MSSALTGLLPPILSTLTEKYPLMTLFVDSGSSNDLYAKIISGDLHAAVIIEPQFSMPKTCDWVSWRAEPLIVLAHRGITERDPHAILASQPFIRSDPKQWGGRLGEDYLQQNDLTVRDRYEIGRWIPSPFWSTASWACRLCLTGRRPGPKDYLAENMPAPVVPGAARRRAVAPRHPAHPTGTGTPDESPATRFRRRGRDP